MMRKRFLSLTCALVLCLSLLPVTALAAAPNGQVIYVGNENVTSGGYWTTDSAGTVTAFTGEGSPADKFIHYDVANNTLTLHNATIKESVSMDTSTFIAGAAIGVHNQRGAAELTITLEGTNTIAEVGKGIYVLANSTDGATLTITGDGSLDASARQTGIWVQSNNGNGALFIQNAKVEATGTFRGVNVQSHESWTAALTVDGGSLTASGSPGILYDSIGSGTVPNTTALTISNSAIVDARNGEIGAGSTTNLQPVSPSGEGIVFNGDEGTVYGNVTLQENLTIGKGESLNIPSGASLTIPEGTTLTVNGGELTGENIPTEGVVYKVTEVKLDKDSLSLEVGGTATLTATITPSNATDQNVTWSSDPSGIVTITPDTSDSKKATITATGTGTTTIKATVDGKSAECSVTVNAAATVPVESVSLDKTELSLEVGGEETLTATVAPTNATNKNVTWESSNTSVATVDATGKVTAIGAGTATITVTTVNQSKTATCEVTVTAATVPVTGVTLSQTQASLYYNRTPNTLTLTATVAPDNATNKAVTWTSSNPSVATVENGVVTALARGTAVITATAADGSGASASCTVTVSSYLPPANPNYRITVEATQGGTVTADPTAAKAGATVTLTPVPDRGYQVGAVAVTDRFGNAVAVTEQADGTYTFTMPNGQVTVTVTFAEAPLPFPDVTEGDWFYDAVRYAYETGLMDGVGDSLFAPNSETTRAQLVTILYRLAGEPEPGGDSGFADVAAGTWYTDAVAWAAQNGIVNGVSDTEFAPGDDITREQLAAILYRYAACQGYDVSQRADLSGFGDASSISGYAQEALSWAHAQGLVLGFEDGSLRPQGTASRAQIAAVLMRFLAAVPTE